MGELTYEAVRNLLVLHQKYLRKSMESGDFDVNNIIDADIEDSETYCFKFFECAQEIEKTEPKFLKFNTAEFIFFRDLVGITYDFDRWDAKIKAEQAKNLQVRNKDK